MCHIPYICIVYVNVIDDIIQNLQRMTYDPWKQHMHMRIFHNCKDSWVCAPRIWGRARAAAAQPHEAHDGNPTMDLAPSSNLRHPAAFRVGPRKAST